MRTFPSIAALHEATGQHLGYSDWHAVDQKQVDLFAEATGDHQWIHVDPERCARDSPFGAPIAHGFLTLSLVSTLFEQAIAMVDAKMVVNYGLNKVRFPAPVPVGSRVRARLTLTKIDAIDGGAQLEWSVVIEREGGARPVCVAELLLRRYP